jgi:GTP-binding protein YchF
MANLEIGIVGVPGCGKTTVLAALTGSMPATGGQAKPNLGIASVPDTRLQPLADTVGAKKITPATMQLVDLPGIGIGAQSGGKGTGELLAQVRQVDALVHVVRCFDASGLPPDPQGDLEGLDVELVAADAEMVERRVAAATAATKSGDKGAVAQAEAFAKFLDHLNEGEPARTYPGGPPAGLDLLTDKPVLVLANTGEDGSAEHVATVEAYAKQAGAGVVAMCAQLEAEIATLDEDERAAFLEDMGVTEPGAHRVARAAFELLDLLTFFTVGEKETRAWLVRRGADAVEAAGKIHTDIARGFIRAEVMDAADLLELGSAAEVSKAGKQRLEGKTYEVRDGDVMNIRFNV